MRHSPENGVFSGTCMGLPSELLGKYSAELQALEKLLSSKADEAAQERRERLVAVVADMRYVVMSPVVAGRHPRTGAGS